MKIDILTLFPQMFSGPFDESIIKRARDKKQVEINIHQLRKWTTDRHQTVDDRPYGGGVGMVLKVEPIYEALKELSGGQPELKPQHKPKTDLKKKAESPDPRLTRIILLTPQGQIFNQKKARELAQMEHLIIISGHYEGYDERIRRYLINEEISIGDYVLTGGELPAMVICDTIVRLLPGVLEKPEATQFESFSGLKTADPQSTSLLEYPQYTHPAIFNGWEVPEVLLSGNHKRIEKWRYDQALQKTKKKRPDLFNAGDKSTLHNLPD